MDSPHDFPHAIELGLDVEPDPVDRVVIERCGCGVYESDVHDVDDCLEAQADALAWAEEQQAAGDPRGHFRIENAGDVRDAVDDPAKYGPRP